MFSCEFCGRAFTRKFNLTRHLTSKHSMLNNDANTVDKNTYNLNSDIIDDSISSDTTENDVDGRSDVNSRNEEEDNDKQDKWAQPLEFNNFVQEIPDKGDSFSQRVLEAAKAIKSKFNALRESKTNYQNFGNKILIRKDQVNTENNNNAAVLEAKLLELLQSALDLLMIKELQNIDITDQGDRENNDDNNRVKLKRSFNYVNEQPNEGEIKTSEETPFKRLKLDNSIKFKNGDNNRSINSKYVLWKYWDDPNTLVDELRILVNTDIGQEISTIRETLSNNTQYRNHYPTLDDDEKRNELIKNLNELNKTNIGQQIRNILDELLKAKIIEPIDYTAKGEEDHSTIDDDDGGIAGGGLYIPSSYKLKRIC